MHIKENQEYEEKTKKENADVARNSLSCYNTSYGMIPQRGVAHYLFMIISNKQWVYFRFFVLGKVLWLFFFLIDKYILMYIYEYTYYHVGVIYIHIVQAVISKQSQITDVFKIYFWISAIILLTVFYIFIIWNLSS